MLTGQYTKMTLHNETFKIHKDIKEDFESKLNNLEVVCKLLGYSIQSEINEVWGKSGKIKDHFFIDYRITTDRKNDGYFMQIRLTPYTRILGLVYTSVIGQPGFSSTSDLDYVSNNKRAINLLDDLVENL